MSALPTGMIGALAEVVLRVRSLDRMQAFYTEVLGLPLWRRFGNDMAFFKLPAGDFDRPQTLALFADAWPPNVPGRDWGSVDPSRSTLHHMAFSLTLESLDAAARLLVSSGIPTHPRAFPWVGWRSLMLSDPEDNTVELVAFDPAVLDEETGR